MIGFLRFALHASKRWNLSRPQQKFHLKTRPPSSLAPWREQQTDFGETCLFFFWRFVSWRIRGGFVEDSLRVRCCCCCCCCGSVSVETSNTILNKQKSSQGCFTQNMLKHCEKHAGQCQTSFMRSWFSSSWQIRGSFRKTKKKITPIKMVGA